MTAETHIQIDGRGLLAAGAAGAATTAASKLLPAKRTSNDRLRSVEEHLKFHPGKPASQPAHPKQSVPAVKETESVKEGLGFIAAAVAAAGTATSLIPSGFAKTAAPITKPIAATMSSKLVTTTAKYSAPPVLLLISVVVALKHGQTREKILSWLMQGGMWALKQQFAAASPPPQRFLLHAEATTNSYMQDVVGQLLHLLPLEHHTERLQKGTKELTREEIIALWFDIEVCSFTRIAVGLFALGISHFISSATHALSPGGPSGFFAVTEILDIPLQLNIEAMVRTAAAKCRTALKERGLDRLSSKGKIAEIEAVLGETRSALEEDMGIGSDPSVLLHEAVLGEERAGERSVRGDVRVSSDEDVLLKQLRDILESPGPCHLLKKTLDTFFGVAREHMNHAFFACTQNDPKLAGLDEKTVDVCKGLSLCQNICHEKNKTNRCQCGSSAQGCPTNCVRSPKMTTSIFSHCGYGFRGFFGGEGFVFEVKFCPYDVPHPIQPSCPCAFRRK